ncbi:MAG: HD domain-containing protein [Succinivibrio sp.]|nr:HD domain-containing protein [Succinivibrio sp.]
MEIFDAIKKMIGNPDNTTHDINHLLLVHSFAALIGRMEKLNDRTQYVLELAAVVHDISCPYLRSEYGSAPGERQERESEKYLSKFFEDENIDEEILKRIFYLVSHHHTYSDINGLDYQILIEADFLVVAQEKHLSEQIIRNTQHKIFKTESGKSLLENILLRG